MASIPPNVENTEFCNFLDLAQDCEQVAIKVYQTCPDMHLMYPGGVPQMMAMPAALNNTPLSVQKQVLQKKMDMFNQMLKTFEASKNGSGSSALPDAAPQSGSASSLASRSINQSAWIFDPSFGNKNVLFVCLTS